MNNLAQDLPPVREMANAIRALSMDAVEAANSGHPGMPMGMADVATVLFTKFLKFDASAPHWADRDRFVLSAGHGSMLLYSLLHLTGYADFPIEELKRFRQSGAKTAGHPEYGHGAGIETTTGPLGQGIATAVGMAIAERMLAARYGDGIVSHYTYVIAGDGCLMEGISHEAIDLAGHLKLSKLIVLFDDNSISIDGATSLATSMDQLGRFRAAGWEVSSVDGHDPAAVEAAIAKARQNERPSLIACKTKIGYGAPNKQGSEKTHGAPLGKEEIKAARAHLGWPYPPFEIPPKLLAAWRSAGSRGAAARELWEARVTELDTATRQRFNDDLSGGLSPAVRKAILEFKRGVAAEKPKLATRQCSQKVLDALAAAQPNLVGGSADLTHSNLTLAKGQKSITPEDFSGSYIHYGVREHGMAAEMNGIALHGGFIPYGGTFLVFADYCRPAIRLSALMGQRVIYVLTHDSIGLGEDGPTHQPVETIPSLRAMPNLLVFRPADGVETAEAWLCALENTDGPSVLCLSRQGLPTVRTNVDSVNAVALGGYVLVEPEGGRDVTLLATGSEIAIALDAAKTLAAEGVKAAVVSMPCFELFDKQPREYRDKVLGAAPRVAIEAAIQQGWEKYTGSDGLFIGMKGFGASAPIYDLYTNFGITAEAAANAARGLIPG